MKITYDKQAENAVYIHMDTLGLVDNTTVFENIYEIALVSFDLSEKNTIVWIEIVAWNNLKTFITNKWKCKINIDYINNIFEIIFSLDEVAHFFDNKDFDNQYLKENIYIWVWSNREIISIKILDFVKILNLNTLNLNIDWVEY